MASESVTVMETRSSTQPCPRCGESAVITITEERWAFDGSPTFVHTLSCPNRHQLTDAEAARIWQRAS